MRVGGGGGVSIISSNKKYIQIKIVCFLPGATTFVESRALHKLVITIHDIQESTLEIVELVNSWKTSSSKRMSAFP